MMERLAVFLALSFLAFLGYVTFCVAMAYGEPVNGQDYLAAQHKRFNAFEAGKALKCCDATGNLDWTFGESLEPIEQLLKASPKFHRVHIFNGACIRGGNCGAYEVSRGFSLEKWDKAIRNRNQKILSHFKARVALYRDLCARYPTTQCLLSPQLEHNLSKKAYRILADAAKEVWPDVQLVNSPVGGISIEEYRGAWIERHGTNPQKDADIVSTDGAEITDIDVDAFLARTNRNRMKIRYAWSRVMNCRDQGPFKDPRKRTSCPTPGIFEELAHIFDDRGHKPQGLPPGCAKVKPFKSPAIWKPLAEDDGNGDKRANKPVALVKPDIKKLLVIASNGEIVGELPQFPDSNITQLRRYYSALGSNVNGYAFEKRATAITGNPHVYLKAKKVCQGPLLTGRRAGVYK